MPVQCVYKWSVQCANKWPVQRVTNTSAVREQMPVCSAQTNGSAYRFCDGIAADREFLSGRLLFLFAKPGIGQA